MIRSSKLSLKFSNTNKKNDLYSFMDEYRSVMIEFINIIWEMDKIPQLLPKKITNEVKTWISSRAVQCAGKQASSVVRGTQTKQKRRLWQINKFRENGMYKKERKLQEIYDKNTISKPEINNIECELDSRFINQDFNNSTSFDGWVTISSLGNRKKIILPVKKSKHFNKLLSKGIILNGVRLSKEQITFNFQIEQPEKKTTGIILGIDIGKTDAISCSNGIQSKQDIHGHTLGSIIDEMSKKKKGSKSFQRKQSHRKNYINWSINQLNLVDYKQINIERIRNMRKRKRVNRKLSSWTYTEIFDKLKDKCLRQGVLVKEISSTYTSQRCSSCGWVRKANRKGKIFKCNSCGYTQDADLNASINISLNLPTISKKIRLKNLNRKGFFWNFDCQHNIVAGDQKTKSL